MIRSIFLYLDRAYLMQTPGLKSLWEYALELFRELLFEERFKQSILQHFSSFLEQERQGNSVPLSLLKSITRMTQDVSIYFSFLEPTVCETTQSFYEKQVSKLLRSWTTDPHSQSSSMMSLYLQNVFQFLKQEKERCEPGQGYLDLSTKKKLVFIIEEEMIRKHVNVLLDKGRFLSLYIII